MSFGTAPGFWWRPPGWQAAMLSPAAALYGALAARRLREGPRASVDLPVLLVGNFTAGGAGKTPAALALAGAAAAMGHRPGFLSRGHGGSAAGPLLVDPARHDAAFTGDEPQLLAGLAPTVIARDRAAGAALLRRETDCDLLVMDDGFQSARLAADLALVVVDARRGLGNRRVLPAGPLRAPLEVQLEHADAVLLVGEEAAGNAASRLAHEAGLPVHAARLEPTNAAALLGAPLLAFSGIADPEKFHATLRGIGADVRSRRDFPDHHPFGEAEIAALLAEAERDGLVPATTAKDAARLRAGASGRALLARSRVLEVALAFAPGAAEGLIAQAFAAFAARSQP